MILPIKLCLFIQLSYYELIHAVMKSVGIDKKVNNNDI